MYINFILDLFSLQKPTQKSMRSSSSSSFPEPVRGTPFVGSIPSTAVTSPVPSPIEAPGTPELCNVDRLDRGLNRLFKLWYPLVWYAISSVDHVAFECSSKILEIRVYKFPNYFMVRCDLKKMSI